MKMTTLPIHTDTPVRIHTEEIPAYAAANLAQVLSAEIHKAYSDPAIQEDYRRWKARRATT